MAGKFEQGDRVFVTDGRIGTVVGPVEKQPDTLAVEFDGAYCYMHVGIDRPRGLVAIRKLRPYTGQKPCPTVEEYHAMKAAR